MKDHNVSVLMSLASLSPNAGSKTEEYLRAKLAEELAELAQEVELGRVVSALMELGDVVYYSAQIQAMTGEDVDTDGTLREAGVYDGIVSILPERVLASFDTLEDVGTMAAWAKYFTRFVENDRVKHELDEAKAVADFLLAMSRGGDTA